MFGGLCGLILAATVGLGSSPVAGRCFDAGGSELFYLDVGQGEPVIVLHGFAMTFGKKLIAGRLAGALGPHYRLIAPHLRGHGRSDTPHDPASYGLVMVEDVIHLLDELGLERAHIIGYSFGGLIGLKLATLHPDRVTSLVIAGMGWLSPNQDLALAEALALALENEASLRPLLKLLAASPEQLSNLQPLIDAMDTKALAACIRSTPELVISEERLRNNQTPTLAVIGENDIFRASVELMREVKPNLTVAVVVGSAHSAAAAPDSLQRIRSFLEQAASR